MRTFTASSLTVLTWMTVRRALETPGLVAGSLLHCNSHLTGSALPLDLSGMLASIEPQYMLCLFVWIAASQSMSWTPMAAIGPEVAQVWAAILCPCFSHHVSIVAVCGFSHLRPCV